MIKFFLGLSALLLLFVAAPTAAHAQRPGVGVRNNRTPTLRDDSRQALRRTHRVLVLAQNAVKQNKNYTGHLARAIRQQRYAVALHTQGRYRAAIHHTRYARRLARLAIENNRGQMPAGFDAENKTDASYDSDAPSDAQMDGAIPADTLTDEQATTTEVPNGGDEQEGGGDKK